MSPVAPEPVPSETTAPDLDSSEVDAERRLSRSWWDSPRRWVLLYALVFVATEAVGAFGYIETQATLDALFAFVAVNHAVFGHRTQRTAGLVMASLFATRLMVNAIPITDASVPTRTAIIGAAGLIVAYVASWVLSHDVSVGRETEGFALKRPLVNKAFTELITVLAGIPIGVAAYFALDPSPLILSNVFGTSELPVIAAIAGLGLGALAEELLYRRLVAAMVQHTGQSQTPWISGALYGGSFLPTQNAGMVALMTVTGAAFAWSCERTGSIRSVVAAHFVASILVFVVLP